MVRRFQTTSWSLILRARSGESTEARQALESLCEVYWYPLYGFVRYQGYTADQAADLVQGYFTVLFEKHYLEDVDPDFGRFRSFLLSSLKHFLYNEHDKQRALKRGGNIRRVSLDAEEAEGRYRLEPPDERTPEQIFERRWAITVLERVLARLGAERAEAGKAEEFVQLREFLTSDGPGRPYKEVAEELGRSEGAIKVAVHRLRARFGALLRAEIEQTVVDPGDIDDEIHHLLAVINAK